jgi:hypothetical protein
VRADSRRCDVRDSRALAGCFKCWANKRRLGSSGAYVRLYAPVACQTMARPERRFGTSRHFSPVCNFGRKRGIADTAMIASGNRDDALTHHVTFSLAPRAKTALHKPLSESHFEPIRC